MTTQLEITLAAAVIWASAPIQARIISNSFVYRLMHDDPATDLAEGDNLRNITKRVRRWAIVAWAVFIILSVVLPD